MSIPVVRLKWKWGSVRSKVVSNKSSLSRIKATIENDKLIYVFLIPI
jgi:hypothetical protein